MTPPPSTPTPAKPPSMNIAMLLVGSVLIAGGATAGWMVGGKGEFKKGYDRGYSEAKAKIEASGLLGLGAATTSTTRLDGSISAVGDGSLDVDIPQLVRNPLDEQAPTSRRVMVDGNTKIMIATQKSFEEFQDDLEKFQAESEKYQRGLQDLSTPPGPPPMPPSQMVQEEAELADLEPGMSVTVSAATDIMMASSFTATEIIAQESLVVPPPTAAQPQLPGGPTPPSPSGPAVSPGPSPLTQ